MAARRADDTPRNVAQDKSNGGNSGEGVGVGVGIGNGASTGGWRGGSKRRRYMVIKKEMSLREKSGAVH